MKKTRREAMQLMLSGAAYVLTARKTRAANTIDEVIEILPEEEIGLIRPELHGQFAEHLGGCVYGGLWVGVDSKIPNLSGYRQSAVAYLRALGVPVLRWPGGCFADDYHWRDGIGRAAQRPKSVNTHGGHYIEDNGFGTHEFMGLCELIGAQPYLAGNVGSGSPQELRNWMEYCNFPKGSSLADERIRNGADAPFNAKYWGVGNEAWGCGGNLSGDEYAEQYRRFGTYLSKFGDAIPFLIACGPNRDNQEWTEKFLAGLHGKKLPDGYAMHFYSNSKVEATKFTVNDMYEQFATISKLEEAILHQRRLMDAVDPEKKMGLLVDEWGVWDRMNPDEERVHGRLWQQITMRAGVTTALGLNVFHRQADKLVMCNVAQMVNVLDAMLLTEDEKCVRTPSYYAFLLAKVHQGRTSVKVNPPQANSTELSVSASRIGGSVAVTIVNPKADTSLRVRCVINGRKAVSATARSLFNGDLNAYNSLDGPEVIFPQRLEVETRPEGLLLQVPALSVTTVEAEVER
jgi:alpha-L-arabinofuranosidase